LNSQLEFRPRFFRGAKERGEGNKREKVKERIVESLEVILMKRIVAERYDKEREYRKK
jgi:aspartate carbamoyltransferase catalytic subunit